MSCLQNASRVEVAPILAQEAFSKSEYNLFALFKNVIIVPVKLAAALIAPLKSNPRWITFQRCLIGSKEAIYCLFNACFKTVNATPA